MLEKQRESFAASKNYQKVKLHLQRNKGTYVAGIGGASLAGITCLIMRGAASQPINCGTSVVAERGISVLGKKVVMSNVSYVSADRQGPPSWVVRCKQTGDIFTSQRSAAVEMGLSQAELSKHLNGVMDNVRGYNFERICLAA